MLSRVIIQDFFLLIINAWSWEFVKVEMADTSSESLSKRNKTRVKSKKKSLKDYLFRLWNLWLYLSLSGKDLIVNRKSPHVEQFRVGLCINQTKPASVMFLCSSAIDKRILEKTLKICCFNDLVDIKMLLNYLTLKTLKDNLLWKSFWSKTKDLSLFKWSLY